ncbi:MAG: hypothetical protein KKI14_04145 [Nanoarchaeota archaeon]|nr:hypothetical protein [Patescibacteria group bacterium]MBU4002904.1 hypothetical protein [Pseudomonadota bacterium]MBU4124625.1 hypothetical protein [Nanoarchaeota archaeon]
MKKTKIDEFLQVVDEIYGVYLDSTNGFCCIKEKTESTQKESCRRSNLTMQYLNNRKVFYGKGNPNDPKSYPLHVCTQGEFKKRNEDNGKNYKVIANLCLVQIYQYWDSHYRNKIAEEIGKKTLEINIMGDLKYFRDSIIHHRGIALENIKKCKILKWHKVREEINIDREKCEEIIRSIKNQINNLRHH